MQQHGSKYFACRPPDPGRVVKINIYRIRSCCISNKMEPQMKPHCSKHFACRTPPWKVGSKFNFFRVWSCCILNLREWHTQQHSSKYFTCRPPHTHTPQGWDQRVKNQLSKNMVMLHIKLNGITNAATW